MLCAKAGPQRRFARRFRHASCCKNRARTNRIERRARSCGVAAECFLDGVDETEEPIEPRNSKNAIDRIACGEHYRDRRTLLMRANEYGQTATVDVAATRQIDDQKTTDGARAI